MRDGRYTNRSQTNDTISLFFGQDDVFPTLNLHSDTKIPSKAGLASNVNGFLLRRGWFLAGKVVIVTYSTTIERQGLLKTQIIFKASFQAISHIHLNEEITVYHGSHFSILVLILCFHTNKQKKHKLQKDISFSSLAFSIL